MRSMMRKRLVVPEVRKASDSRSMSISARESHEMYLRIIIHAHASAAGARSRSVWGCINLTIEEEEIKQEKREKKINVV